ncbi:probable phosphoglycerate mutase [Pseudonocardia thermophila]|uniref:Probable phosphoglycerate mutase n=1 Tax=Pseudonocardia thermophila TaxID=1848 RepID=A0A1M6XHL3_PSETH|nr:bifunctional RNase H/acid phosphatase [Pseudonocardia thermophila]SHL05441.1 probable phosphoglycerate mutase [Pseudonocardia thermophila]
MKVIVEADGGSRGNPGPAGYGAVVVDAATDEVLAERSGGIGTATNNVAEYRGLIAGLQAAIELGATTVEVRMDSKLVVEQMSGRWKVKHPSMQPLAAEAKALVARFESVTFTWVPRERNARADALANRAMDAQAGEADDPVEATAAEPAVVAWSGQVGEPTRMLLLRHGQTALSVERRYSGHGDPELTELGRLQAARAAARLAAEPDIAAVLTSPLQRARVTAEAVAEATGAPLVVRPGLIETDFGEWEGLSFAEARARDPELHRRWLGDETVAPPGGESFAAVGRRIEIERRAVLAEYPGRTVVVVSHVTPIKMLLRAGLDAGPSLLYRLHLDLASLSEVQFYPDGGASVRLVNDTHHVPD